MKKIILLFAISMLFASACKKEGELPDPEPTTYKISYEYKCNFEHININLLDAQGNTITFTTSDSLWDTTIVYTAGQKINANGQITVMNELVDIQLTVNKDGKYWHQSNMNVYDGGFVEVITIVPN